MWGFPASLQIPGGLRLVFKGVSSALIPSRSSVMGVEWRHGWMAPESCTLLWSLAWWWNMSSDNSSGNTLKQSSFFCLHLEIVSGRMYHEYTPHESGSHIFLKREKILLKKKSSICMVRETQTIIFSSVLMNKIKDSLPSSHPSSSN